MGQDFRVSVLSPPEVHRILNWTPNGGTTSHEIPGGPDHWTSRCAGVSMGDATLSLIVRHAEFHVRGAL